MVDGIGSWNSKGRKINKILHAVRILKPRDPHHDTELERLVEEDVDP